MSGRRFRSGVAARAVVAPAVLGVLAAAYLAYVALASPPPTPPTITAFPASPTSSTTAAFSYKDTQTAGFTRFECSLDGSSFAACGTRVGGSGKSYSGLSGSTRTFRVRAVFGSATSNATPYSWVIDRTAPVATIAFPANSGLYNASSYSAGCSPAGVCGTAADPSGVASVRLSVKRSATARYWNGSGFTASTETFLPVSAVGTPGGTSTTWRSTLALPPAGVYVVHVQATDSLGNAQTGSSYAATSAFTIDTAPPPRPSIYGHPAGSTSATSATFRFADDGDDDGDTGIGDEDDEDGISLLCALTPPLPAVFTPCASPKSYTSLAPGTYTFLVEAVDRAGNLSAPVSFTWTITGAGRPFTITGTASALLYPAGADVPVNLVFRNPNSAAITVTGVTMTILGTSSGLCPLSLADLSVPQQLTVSVGPIPPGNVPTSLSALSVPQSAWPKLRMSDTGTNQDNCQGVTVNLSYSGSAHS